MPASLRRSELCSRSFFSPSFREQSSLLHKLCLFVLALCLTLPAHAEGFITRLLNKPVPGGVAVIDLGNPAQAPKVAVAVLVEDGGDRLSATGGALAAPIGRATIAAALREGS